MSSFVYNAVAPVAAILMLPAYLYEIQPVPPEAPPAVPAEELPPVLGAPARIQLPPRVFRATFTPDTLPPRVQGTNSAAATSPPPSSPPGPAHNDVPGPAARAVVHEPGDHASDPWPGFTRLMDDLVPSPSAEPGPVVPVRPSPQSPGVGVAPAPGATPEAAPPAPGVTPGAMAGAPGDVPPRPEIQAPPIKVAPPAASAPPATPRRAEGPPLGSQGPIQAYAPAYAPAPQYQYYAPAYPYGYPAYQYGSAGCAGGSCGAAPAAGGMSFGGFRGFFGRR